MFIVCKLDATVVLCCVESESQEDYSVIVGFMRTLYWLIISVRKGMRMVYDVNCYQYTCRSDVWRSA